MKNHAGTARKHVEERDTISDDQWVTTPDDIKDSRDTINSKAMNAADSGQSYEEASARWQKLLGELPHVVSELTILAGENGLTGKIESTRTEADMAAGKHGELTDQLEDRCRKIYNCEYPWYLFTENMKENYIRNLAIVYMKQVLDYIKNDDSAVALSNWPEFTYVGVNADISGVSDVWQMANELDTLITRLKKERHKLRQLLKNAEDVKNNAETEIALLKEKVENVLKVLKNDKRMRTLDVISLLEATFHVGLKSNAEAANEKIA